MTAEKFIDLWATECDNHDNCDTCPFHNLCVAPICTAADELKTIIECRDDSTDPPVSDTNSPLDEIMHVVYSHDLTYIEARHVLHKALKAIGHSKIIPNPNPKEIQ